MTTCCRCAKLIEGEAIHHCPPRYLEVLGLDFRKAFHPACYVKEESEAAKELRVEASK